MTMTIIKKTGEDIEKIKSSYTASGNVKWNRNMDGSLAVPQTVRQTVTI